jgi:hypothetical protein
MALNPKLSNEAANAEADAVAALLDNGYLRIYDGSQPANADAGIGGANLLAELRFNADAFAAAAAGVAAANAFTQDASANATGTATWFRALKSDGTSPIFDGTVGTSGANLNLNSVAIVAGVAVQVTGFTFTASKG